MNVPTKNNKLLEVVLGKVNEHKELQTLWKVINVNAIDRMNFSDHGEVHFQIVANIALRISRILTNKNIKTSLEENYPELSYDHAEVVIFLASVMHDLGMSISRNQHEEFSLILSNRLLHEILDFMNMEDRTVVISETLHAIISHRAGGKPLTIEAGIVRVADALDMSEGRIKVAYAKGEKNIHAISAAAINGVDIKEGSDPNGLVEIVIRMNNSAGLFQIDDLMTNKIKGSGIEDYVTVKAYIEGETEKKLLDEFTIKDF
jgi:hypothetical protein